MTRILLFIGICLLCSECRKQKQLDTEKLSQPSKDLFLSAQHYPKLIIEVTYAPGMKPEESALTALKDFLDGLVNKPEGIELSTREIAVQSQTMYSFADLQALEKTHRSIESENGRAGAYIFFAGGEYNENRPDGKVLGIAYGNSSIVIFEKTIRDFSGGLTQPPVAKVESCVLMHEFGHLLGLVNNGTPMQTEHQDAPHGSHCSNQNCLMYYATETSGIIDNLLGSTPVLDERCREDLRAFGGK